MEVQLHTFPTSKLNEVQQKHTTLLLEKELPIPTGYEVEWAA
jgi:hypothetical protein